MENASLEQIVEAVVRSVLHALAERTSTTPPPASAETESGPRPPSRSNDETGADVLALFTGSYHAVDQVTAGFRTVSGAGYSIAGMLSRGAQNVFAGRASPEGLSVTRILPYEYPKKFAPFFSGFKVVVLPTLTRTTAAKLAWGICDTLVLEATYTSLALSLPVIAATDGMSGEENCPECANFLPYVRELNSEYLKRLEKLGVRLIRAEQLGDEILRFLRGARTPGPAYRGVITLDDVKSVMGGEILIVEGSIITALARDHLRDHGVAIRFVPPNTAG